MNKKLLLTAVCFGVMSCTLLAEELVWEDLSRGNSNIQAILVNPPDNKVIFAGVPGSVLMTDNAGLTWRRVLSIRGRLRNINVLITEAGDFNIVYAATDNGLYRSGNLGARWARIFRGKNSLENQCTSVFSTAQGIFLGTRAGFFVSRDKGRSWRKDNGEIGKNEVINIDAPFKQNTVVYLSAVNGIFKSIDSGNNWEKIFVSNSKEDISHEDLENEESLFKKTSDLRFVKAGINNINLLYLSTSKGIYKSPDQGKSWIKLSEYGLLDRDVKMICVSENSQIFALCRSGVFVFEDSHWVEVSFGLPAGKFNYLSLDSKFNIYVAAEKGLFRSSPPDLSSFSRQSLMQEYLKREPKIRDVQKAAINYAEVGPEKISAWRKKAAKKALFPQVRVGLDRNSTDLWHWEGGSSTKAEDDILRRGQDSIDWDVSISWDFGDLIWNDAQTSIDVRSKLMVELRDDILDQVNKLYFERLRVKSELDNLPIEDRKKIFDKQLRLEELTASLDSLTAGYYSDQLRRLADKHRG
ncbi:MAG: hypothetical protein PHR84_05540 [Candidatus Omnitrophica bacterium]|nr:hypothetical protein [Candidatus Omnitrophota bacterium]MDD5661160.1 hypothetical protein [Candidatus Omnitrophota bacterium]